VATNRINAPDTAESLLSDDVSDLISMARPLLADPDLLQKAYNSQADTINTCIACNQACLDHAFVGKTASCLVNPAACHEDELTTHLLPESQRLKIGVIGAGPAGCSFALTAAQMGHHVTLYDKSDKVGGQFHMAKRM
jgi:2,4-dienoyl-CoA reductase (NADPH2)